MTLKAFEHASRFYSVDRKPTADDTFVDLTTYYGVTNDVGVPDYTLFYLKDDTHSLFLFEGLDNSGKAIYRELCDSRHVEQLQTTITALQGRLNSLESPVVTEGTLTADVTDVTGNNTEYNIIFSDSSNSSLWTEGRTTLQTGIYHFSLILHLADIPLATNSIYIAVKIEPTDKSKPIETYPYRIDADRLVRSESAMNVDTKTSYFRVTEESEVYFTIRIDGGGSDAIDLNASTRVLIWR